MSVQIQVFTALAFLVLAVLAHDGHNSTGGTDHLQKEPHFKLAVSLNPGCSFKSCNINNTLVSLVNITVKREAPVDNDAIKHEHRWIWTVLDHPTVQLALTDPEDELEVDWMALLGKGDLDSAIQYEKKPSYSAAIMLGKLVEFDDCENLGSADAYPMSSVIVYPLTNFNWSRTLIENTTERAAMGFIGTNYTIKGEKEPYKILEGKLNITISAYALSGFGVWLPHLSHSESTNQMDIQLDGLKTNSGFNCSRYALEMVLVSNAQKDTKVHRASTDTLDDEYTPGIFQTQELIIPGYNNSLQAYMQWRPVVYTTVDRDLSSSTEVNISAPVDVLRPSRDLNGTILYAMYGADLDDMLVMRLNVTLGGGSDGYFKKTHFQAWTFTIGSGVPIHNGFSPILVLTITIMFGLMLLVLITSGIICLCKRFKARQSANTGYGRLQNN